MQPNPSQAIFDALPKLWNRESIQELLDKNDHAVERALLIVYRHQTETEQQVERTFLGNSVGFDQADAKLLSIFAKSLIELGQLTKEQLQVCRAIDGKGAHKLGKYWRQLVAAIPE